MNHGDRFGAAAGRCRRPPGALPATFHVWRQTIVSALKTKTDKDEESPVLVTVLIAWRSRQRVGVLKIECRPVGQVHPDTETSGCQ